MLSPNKQIRGANGSRLVKSIVFECRFGFRTAEQSGGRRRGAAQTQREARSRWARALLRPGASTLSLPWTTAGSRKSRWRCSRGERRTGVTQRGCLPTLWEAMLPTALWITLILLLRRAGKCSLLNTADVGIFDSAGTITGFSFWFNNWIKCVCGPQHQQDGWSKWSVLPFLHTRNPPQLCHVCSGPVASRHS